MAWEEVDEIVFCKSQYMVLAFSKPHNTWHFIIILISNNVIIPNAKMYDFEMPNVVLSSNLEIY